jgi:hypothetical protein
MKPERCLDNLGKRYTGPIVDCAQISDKCKMRKISHTIGHVAGWFVEEENDQPSSSSRLKSAIRNAREIVFRDERDSVKRHKAYVEERGLGSGVCKTHASKGRAFDGSAKDLRVWGRVDG